VTFLFVQIFRGEVDGVCAESDIYLWVSDILLSQSDIRLTTGDIFPNGKVMVDIKKAQYFHTALKFVDR